MREGQHRVDSKLKLDLHTHCYEATGYGKPTLAVATKILDSIRARGLDGIAITDHYNAAFAWEVKRIIEESCNSDILVLPGREIEEDFLEIVELYLPDGATFRFVAHPGYPYCFAEDSLTSARNIHGIEVQNGGHKWQINSEMITRVAQKHDLLLLSNSDAHYLEDIGRSYNEVSLAELCVRARGNPRRTGP